MASIDRHIEEDKNLLDNPTISSQFRRHVEGELQALEAYKLNHPEEDYDPTPLELYCDANPNALECKLFDT